MREIISKFTITIYRVMRPATLLIILFLSCTPASAQNWQCVLPNQTNFFTNADHYLRGIRIDSIKTISGNIVLYPYKTARGQYLGDKFTLRRGGSWLGNIITIQPDGTHLFGTYREDTVIIRAQAGVNDSWLLYDDTASTFYEATVTMVDTMTVLGNSDSIKVIKIIAREQNGVRTQDSLNNKEIILSKNHGFIQTIDLYMFPIQGLDLLTMRDIDYFTLKAGAFSFHITDFKNPGKFAIYDFRTGDVFQQYAYNIPSPRDHSEIHDSIISKTIISPSEIEYIIWHYENSYNQITKKTKITQTTDTLNVDIGPLITTTEMPEEWGMTSYIYYNPADTTFCFTGHKYSILTNYIVYKGDSAWAKTLYPCGGANNEYKAGIGRVHYSECVDINAGGPNPVTNMTFVRKNGIPCGAYYNVGIKNITSKNRITLYPNPVTDLLYVSTDIQNISVSMFDVMGHTVFQRTSPSGEMSIDTHQLANGIYFVRLTNDDGYISNHRVIISH